MMVMEREMRWERKRRGGGRESGIEEEGEGEERGRVQEGKETSSLKTLEKPILRRTHLNHRLEHDFVFRLVEARRAHHGQPALIVVIDLVIVVMVVFGIVDIVLVIDVATTTATSSTLPPRLNINPALFAPRAMLTRRCRRRRPAEMPPSASSTCSFEWG